MSATLNDKQPKRIRDRLTRRDQRNEANWFEVSIDSPYNRPTGRRLTDAFRDGPRNTFIVKLRYTIR